MSKLLNDYNTSISTLRKKEYLYFAWINKYWGEDEAAKYDTFMNSVRAFDKALHSLNDEFEKVNITEEQKKVDRKRAEEALKEMQPAVKQLREQGRDFLVSL